MIRKQSHDGSLATVRAICFRVHHGCIILRTIFYDTVHFAHFQKLLVCQGSLKRNSLSSQKTEHEKNRGKVTEIQCRHCASAFLLS